MKMKKPVFDLSGSVALVTGGGSGLGLAMAEGLAAAGATVAIVGRNTERIEAAAAAFRDAGAKAQAFTCDLADRTAIPGLVADVVRELGQIDILVNNAGIQHRAPFTDFPADRWDAMMAIHLSAAFFLSQAVVPDMIKRGRGKIINTLSVGSELGRATIVPYTTAKGGLKMLTRGLATELGPHNIQVNGIAPGYFKTELNKALSEDPAFDAWVRGRTPARRWGDPSELAGAAVFLASPAADFITGHVLFVDGGLTASS
jgi:gluconate 5-dehydrogenase